MSRVRRPAAATIVALTLVSLAVGPAAAESTVAQIDWRATAPLSGSVVDGAVEVATSGGGAFPLAVIEAPELGPVGYAIRGQVRYSDVEATGYLELWSEFADGGRYFSRTLAPSGPLAALTGTSGWRDFELPMDLGGAAGPTRLELNLVLPGAGTVAVGPVRLVRFEQGESPLAASRGRSIDELVGLVGGLAGAALGIAGGTIGVLAGRRKAPRVVLASLKAGVALGFGLVAAGFVSLVTGQPGSVTYVCFLLGGITAGVSAALLPGIRRAYAEAELRRMRALDRT